jgi:hypothetical protein
MSYIQYIGAATVNGYQRSFLTMNTTNGKYVVEYRRNPEIASNPIRQLVDGIKTLADAVNLEPPELIYGLSEGVTRVLAELKIERGLRSKTQEFTERLYEAAKPLAGRHGDYHDMPF